MRINKDSQKAPNLRFKGFTDDWEQRELSHLVEINSGRDYKHLNTGNIPVYGTGGLMLFVDKALSYDEDGIGIGRKGTIDKPYILKAPFWTVDTLFYCIPKGQTNIYFGYAIFQKINWKFKDESTGVPSLSKKTISTVKIYSTKYEEQEKIGLLFKLLDNNITLHQRKLDQLNQLKEALLQQMFPGKGENVPKLRFAGFEGEWEERKLGDLMEVTSVKRIHQSDWTTSGIRFLRARDIVSAARNEIPVDLLYISKEKYDEYTAISGKVEVGDLLVTGVGTIGVPMLIKSSDPLYFKDGNIIWFKNNNKIDPDFLYFSFTNDTIQNFIQQAAGVGTVGTYTINSGSNTPIFLANKFEQHHVGSFFKNFNNFITLQQRKLNQLKNTKQVLLENMFI